MLKAYKYRIYPNKSQIKHLVHSFGCARFIYNQALDYKINKKSFNLVGFKNKLKWLKLEKTRSILNSLNLRVNIIYPQQDVKKSFIRKKYIRL